MVGKAIYFVTFEMDLIKKEWIMINTFFIYLLHVSLCHILFYGFYHFFLRKDNFFRLNRIYLIGTAILAVFIPFLGPVLPSLFSWDDKLMEQIATIFSGEQGGTSSTAFFFMIYCFGVAALVCKLVINMFFIFFLALRNSVRDKEGYHLVNTSHPHPVFTFMNMIFWSDKNGYTEEQKKQILLHEQVHVKQRHSWDILLLELLSIIFWFNPIIHFYKSNLEKIHYFIADKYHSQQLQFAKKDLQLLLKDAKSHGGDVLPLAHTFYSENINERIDWMNSKDEQSNKFKFLASFIIILVLLF